MDEPLNVAAIWPLGSDWSRGNERPAGSPGCLASANVAIDIRVLARAHKNIVVVALANKLARIAWAVLAHGGPFDAGHMANA